MIQKLCTFKDSNLGVRLFNDSHITSSYHIRGVCENKLKLIDTFHRGPPEKYTVSPAQKRKFSESFILQNLSAGQGTIGSRGTFKPENVGSFTFTPIRRATRHPMLLLLKLLLAYVSFFMTLLFKKPYKSHIFVFLNGKNITTKYNRFITCYGESGTFRLVDLAYFVGIGNYTISDSKGIVIIGLEPEHYPTIGCGSETKILKITDFINLENLVKLDYF